MVAASSPLLSQWFDQVWNQGNISAVDDLLAPGGVVHETAVDGVQKLGPSDFKALAATVRKAIPDIHFVVDDGFEHGDEAAAHVVVTGTHCGPGLGIAATGRRFRIAGVAMARFENGKIVEAWSTFDMLSLFDQLGALKRPLIG